MDTKNRGTVRGMLCDIATGTVIEVGDLVGMTDGLIVKADETTTKIARALQASASGDTKIEVTRGKAEVLMTGDAVFAAAYRGDEVDIVMSGDDQQVDVATSSTLVLQISPEEGAGVVGSASNIKCFINKPLDERA